MIYTIDFILYIDEYFGHISYFVITTVYQWAKFISNQRCFFLSNHVSIYFPLFVNKRIHLKKKIYIYKVHQNIVTRFNLKRT